MVQLTAPLRQAFSRLRRRHPAAPPPLADADAESETSAALHPFHITPQSLLPLPYELLFTILSDPAIDRSTLTHCCRASKALCLVARDVLYREVGFSLSEQSYYGTYSLVATGPSLLLSRVFVAIPELAAAARSLHFKYGNRVPKDPQTRRADVSILHEITRSCMNVNQLELFDFDGRDDFVLGEAGPFEALFGQLRTLVLQRYWYWDGKALLNFLYHLDSLTSLTISHPKGIAHDPPPECLPPPFHLSSFSFRHINMSYMPYMSPAISFAPLTVFTQKPVSKLTLFNHIVHHSHASLTTLSLGFIVSSTGEMEALNLGRFTSLDSLTLTFQLHEQTNGKTLLPTLTDELASCTHLRHLSLDFSLLPWRLFRILPPDTVDFDLYFTDPHAELGFALIAAISKTITSLRLAYPVRADTIAWFLKGTNAFPELRYIEYGHWARADKQGMVELVNTVVDAGVEMDIFEKKWDEELRKVEDRGGIV